VELQRLIESRLELESDLRITSAEFLCWIHREFYERLPPEYRVVRSRSGTREMAAPSISRHYRGPPALTRVGPRSVALGARRGGTQQRTARSLAMSPPALKG